MEDYKQRYEQALEYMRKVYPTLDGADKEDAEHYFPELKESEDERIRKALIQHIKYKVSVISGWRKEELIAWLEKQGEQKFPSLSEKEIVCLKRILDFLREEHNSYTGKDFTNEIAVLEWLIIHPVLVHSSELQQNQGWQKPAWSEEDEKMFNSIIEVLEVTPSARFVPIKREIMIPWLKSLKERMKGE